MDTKDKDKDQTEQPDKGFAVHDRRRVGTEAPDEAQSPTPDKQDAQAQSSPEAVEPTPAEQAGPTPEKEHPAPGEGPGGSEHGHVPLNFTTFIMSLSTSALIYLGQVPDPVSGNTVTDIAGARQMIDLISLLKEKTTGNLTPDETAFIDTILYDLRMLFVKAKS